MPRSLSRQDTGKPLRLSPLFPGGLDMDTDAAVLPPEYLARAEDVRCASGVLERRPGEKKLVKLTDSTGSKTFGADTKYATVTAAAQLKIPYGGFGFKVDLTAVRPSGGNTGYILSSRKNGSANHVLSLTISDAGVLTASFLVDGGAVRSATSSAITANAATNVLCVYTDQDGAWSMYVNGALADADAGSTGQRPDQTAVNWYFGVEYNPATPGVTANTHFDGKIDGFTLFTLRGIDALTGTDNPSDGPMSLVNTMRRWTFQQWPNPQQDFVLANYDFDNSSVTVLTDSSRFKNHGTMTGTPTHTAAVSRSTVCGNYVGFFETPSGQKTNVVAAGGDLYYETVRGGT